MNGGVLWLGHGQGTCRGDVGPVTQRDVGRGKGDGGDKAINSHLKFPVMQ